MFSLLAHSDLCSAQSTSAWPVMRASHGTAWNRVTRLLYIFAGLGPQSQGACSAKQSNFVSFNDLWSVLQCRRLLFCSFRAVTRCRSFNPASSQFTWVRCPPRANTPFHSVCCSLLAQLSGSTYTIRSSYGTQRVEAASNQPPPRHFWNNGLAVDSLGSLWLFGGGELRLLTFVRMLRTC